MIRTAIRFVTKNATMLACLFVMLVLMLPQPFEHYILSWDVFGYYLYLPAVFIHNDILLEDISWVHDIVEEYQNTPSLYQINETQNGWTIRYSMGMAILYVPFFLLGHLIAIVFGFSPDGFSEPYNFCMNLGSFTYVFAGLLLLRKLLLQRFSQRVSAIAILVIGLGTNLYQLMSETWGMPHIYLFVLYGILLLLSERWHKKETAAKSAGIGFIVSLLVVCRPSDAVAVFIPLLWGWTSASDLKVYAKIMFKKLGKQWVYVVLGAFLPIALQVWYWWAATGSPIYDSYANPGEGFDFLSPHLIDYLFSFRKGWLVYTPLATLAFIGIVEMIRKKEQNALAITFYLISTLYLLSSWSCWWYGDSFSQRSIGQSYVVFAIPMASVIHWLLGSKILIKVSVSSLIVMAMGLNLFQTWQCREEIIHTSRMTRQAYTAIFGAFQKPQHFDELLLIDRFNTTFDSARYGLVKTLKVINAPETILSDSGAVSSKGIWRYQDLTEQDHVWLKVSAHIYGLDAAEAVLVAHCAHNDKMCHYRPKDLEPTDNKSETSEYEHYYLTPELRSSDDEFVTYIWLPDSGRVRVENLWVEVFEKINPE